MSLTVAEGLLSGKVQIEGELFRKASEDLDIEDCLGVLLSWRVLERKEIPIRRKDYCTGKSSNLGYLSK